MATSMAYVFFEYSFFGLSYHFSQTLSALRIEIENYIIQRQLAEERLAANVSFKHFCFYLLITSGLASRKFRINDARGSLFAMFSYITARSLSFASSMLLECRVSQMNLMQC